jgi:uncharacterized protein YbjQ (UPF0145 family)
MTKMKIPGSRLSVSIAFAMLALAGCASAPPADVQQRAAEMKIYDMDQSVGAPYQVVKRLWTDHWRTAFTAPVYPTQDEALNALRVEAAQLGADGLVNVNCLDQALARWIAKPDPAILCYGIAVRFQPKQG